jgi:8-oxo-dGTP diphosphatase
VADEAVFTEPVKWHASLPGVIVSAAGIIRDPAGSVLLVKPNYRDHWSLPGGICEFGEAPHDGCAREVAEEIGLELPVGPLLSVDWHVASATYGPGARPAVFFIFDCGTLASLDGVTLQASEIDDCLFAGEAELGELLHEGTVPRIRAAIGALSTGCVQYVPQLAGNSATP